MPKVITIISSKTRKKTKSRRYVPVKSSFINAIKHEKGRVKVKIGAKVYSYRDAYGHHFGDMLNAKSKGKEFNKSVKRTEHGNLRPFIRHI